jgi:mannose-6-phosphate isomerase
MSAPDQVASITSAQHRARQFGVSSVEKARLVSKPWGEERWLVPEGAPFGFKLITVRAGCRTSLQYHERKEEAAVILSGNAALHVSHSASGELTELHLTAGDVMHLRPLTCHRIQAITDVRLLEVSTPHLDDVIRVADDYNRPDGRIATEHAPASHHD